MVELGTIGAIGLGIVVGWLLPAAHVGGDRSVAASAAILGAVTAAVGFDQGEAIAGTTLSAALAAAYAKAWWLAELRKRYGARLPG